MSLYARPGTPCLDVPALRASLGIAWNAVVAPGDARHLATGASVELAGTPDAARLYLIVRKKRLTPQRERVVLSAYPADVGKCWDLWNEPALPTVAPVLAVLLDVEAVELRAAIEASVNTRARRPDLASGRTGGRSPSRVRSGESTGCVGLASGAGTP